MLLPYLVLLEAILSCQSDNSINTKPVCFALMTNPCALTCFSRIRDSSHDFIKMKIALDLMEDLLILYLILRIFSYVKNKVQAYPIPKSKTKLRPLRTTLRKKVRNLLQSH